MNQIIQLLTQILTLVEQLVQRQTKQELVDDRDRMIESAVFGDEVITEDQWETKVYDKSLSSPHEFMGSCSKQWSQRYKGLLMDFEGAERQINKLKSDNAAVIKSKEHKVNELNAKLCGANDTIAKLQQEVNEYSAIFEQESNLEKLRSKGIWKLQNAMDYINDKDLFPRA
jgi:hypothetical protein